MNLLLRLFVFALVLFACYSCKSRSGSPKVLVFSKTAGFRHSSIPVAREALVKLGQENGFLVDTTENADYFTEDSLKNYAAVIFLSTTGDVLNHYQEADFERYIQAGGGFVGIHAASDTEYDWPWYGRLVGGYFVSHPQIQEAKLRVLDKDHPSTEHLPDEWVRSDEWYNFKNLNPDVKVLMDIDESSYEGGQNGDEHPMAWYHEVDGGRAFFTALGHTEESYEEELFLKHLLGGIKYAIGGNRHPDYSKATTPRVPLEERFTKISLSKGGFFEPTEMAILPNLDILVSQRRGELMRYRQADSSLKQVGLLNVYHKATVPNVNAEEGFMGLQADPDFAKNNFIYAFYSPFDTSVNRLSRFTFQNDTLDLSTEKVILEFYSQRNICCHTGGSIAFGKDRMLYLSTGDNATPFDEPGQRFVNRGYGPLDDRPGHEQYDARRTSSNTNDLRGKILRIRINEDGTYEIPDGNLFNPGQDSTRPEIFVMGNRNPYRISVDQQTGYLYWGEVGPDAPNDSMETRGPRGYDELNQARTAGYFGWPLFVGYNYSYREYNYQTGTSGSSFNPDAPVNLSRNNTGKKILPAATPPLIWYPYDNSKEFPQLGSGGRNAMAGPVYYAAAYPEKTRLPDYFEGKLFFYDWIRGWIKLVTMNADGDFEKMEPFMPSTKFAAPIDMEMGPDGRLYILEYGMGWFSQNPDAGISVIHYNGGNMLPVVQTPAIDKTSGAVPLTVTVSVEARDPDGKMLSYNWDMGDGTKRETPENTLTHTYNKAGEYQVSVSVRDDQKASVSSDAITVNAGNIRPEPVILLSGNSSFYFPGRKVQYSVQVSDRDNKDSIPDPDGLIVTAAYIEGTDKAAAPQGHQVLSEAMAGKILMEASDCRTCHQIDKKSIGPSFMDIGKKYDDNPQTTSYLAGKIRNGSVGVWGETAMAAHPDMPEADARKIVAYIQSLTAEASQVRSLPANGTLDATLSKPPVNNGVLVITASYTDKGNKPVGPLTGTDIRELRHPSVSLRSIRSFQGMEKGNLNEQPVLKVSAPDNWFRIDSIDLTGIKSVVLDVYADSLQAASYGISVRLDAADGVVWGESTATGKPGSRLKTRITVPVTRQTDGRTRNVYFMLNNGSGLSVSSVKFEPE